MDQFVALDRPIRPLTAGVVGLALRVEQFISSGGRAVVLVGPPGSGKVRLANAVLSGLPGRQTRIAHRAPGPLSMKRILQQIGTQPDEGTDGPFFGMLAEQSYDDQSAAVVVEDADTLSPYALSALARVPGLGGPEQPGMILFLVGEASLLAKLSAPGLDILRNARRTLVLTMPSSGPTLEAGAVRLTWTAILPNSVEAEPAASGVRAQLAAFPIRPAVEEPPRPRPRPFPRRPSSSRPSYWLLAGALTVAAVLGWMVWPEPAPTILSADPTLPSTPVQATADAPSPELDAGTAERALQSSAADLPGTADLVPTEPAAVPTLPPPPVEADAQETASPPAQPAPEPTPAQIKREFDAFLNRAGRDTAKLTPAARQALFREYLQWRIRASLAGP